MNILYVSHCVPFPPDKGERIRAYHVVRSLAARARRLEVAISVKPLWIKRTKIDDELERFANLRPLEEGTLATLDDLNQHVEDHERQRDILRGQRKQLHEEARKLGINVVLVRNAQRLAAL